MCNAAVTICTCESSWPAARRLKRVRGDSSSSPFRRKSRGAWRSNSCPEDPSERLSFRFPNASLGSWAWALLKSDSLPLLGRLPLKPRSPNDVRVESAAVRNGLPDVLASPEDDLCALSCIFILCLRFETKICSPTGWFHILVCLHNNGTQITELRGSAYLSFAMSSTSFHGRDSPLEGFALIAEGSATSISVRAFHVSFSSLCGEAPECGKEATTPMRDDSVTVKGPHHE